jgi:hypothetical protein
MNREPRWRLKQLTAGGALWIGLIGLAVIGVIILPHYGEGVDEWSNYFFGWSFVHAYEDYGLLTNPGIHYFNGPFFMMIWVIVSQALHWAIPSWMLVDGRHFTTFVTFLVGLWLLYRLCMRFMAPRVALLTTALFATQPVLFGHAFINQKDTPFMVFFLAAVVVGWAAADRLADKPVAHPLVPRAAEEWHALTPGARAVFAAGIAVGAALLVDLWVSHGLLGLAEQTVRNAYHGQAWGPINRAFARVATDAYKTSVDLYLAKVDRAMFWLRLPASAIILGGIWWGVSARFPKSAGARLGTWRHRWGLLVLAGLLIGATTSIRIVGPFAGALVALLLVVKLGRRGLIPLLSVAIIAMITTYLTWPVLWGNPINQFINHASGASGFTSFYVLYAGRHYESTNLPWQYLPWLLLIQLTLPAVVAILAGLVRAVWRGAKNAPDRLGLIIVGLWAAVPSASVIFSWVSVYNNFRHELFILPPLFVLGGIGVQWASKIRFWKPLKFGAALLLLVPGVIGIVRLHPYEYLYYNALVGGVDGAVNRYELDYWCTSFRGAMSYVDEHAPPGAQIGVAGALTSASPFARDDLTLYLDRSGTSFPDMALACNRGEADNLFPGLRNVFVIRRGAAVLAVVKGPGG